MADLSLWWRGYPLPADRLTVAERWGIHAAADALSAADGWGPNRKGPEQQGYLDRALRAVEAYQDVAPSAGGLLVSLRATLGEMELHDETGDPVDRGYRTAWQEMKDALDAWERRWNGLPG